MCSPVFQYFTTQSVRRKPEEAEHVPWLPLSVIRPPGLPTSASTTDHAHKCHMDGEANLNALLGTLGPAEEDRPATPMGEAMGGTVGSIRLPGIFVEGEGESEGEREGKQTIQLQRVAPRCHCQVIYVTYGDQVEAEITRSASPGSPLVSARGCGLVGACQPGV